MGVARFSGVLGIAMVFIPKGLQRVAGWLSKRSERHPRCGDAHKSETILKGSQTCDPFVVGVFCQGYGDVAALNHRLHAAMPPALKHTPGETSYTRQDHSAT